MSELLEIADRIVERSGSGERLEAFVARGVETDVRVYEGAIETLSTATSAGVGIRVLLDGPDGARAGFAWAGSLEGGSHRSSDPLRSGERLVCDARPNGGSCGAR